MKGRVISAHGRHYSVELENGQTRHCYTRGKKTGLCVGDYVLIKPQGADEGSIEQTLERQNLLYRSDEMRSKQFAANVDQLLIVVATEPVFSEDLTARALTGAWSAGIEPVILLNKCDLTQGLDRALETLQIYLNNNMNVAKTAEDLMIHRSTLLERLKRIEKLLDSDLKDPDERLCLSIILKINQIQKKDAQEEYKERFPEPAEKPDSKPYIYEYQELEKFF